jgi:hypothetical protein
MVAMNAQLKDNEKIAYAVPLSTAVLIETDQGEVQAWPGEYLVLTDTGRQFKMSETEYQAVRNLLLPVAPEASSPEDLVESAPPEIPAPELPKEAPTKKEKELEKWFGKLGHFGRKKKPAAVPPVLEPAPAEIPPLEAAPVMPEPEKRRPDPPSRSRSTFSYPLPFQKKAAPKPAAPAERLAPTSLQELEDLLHSQRSKRTFAESMKPGPKKPAARRKTALPFRKRTAGKPKEKKDRYEYVSRQWI